MQALAVGASGPGQFEIVTDSDSDNELGSDQSGATFRTTRTKIDCSYSPTMLVSDSAPRTNETSARWHLRVGTNLRDTHEHQRTP